MEQINQLLCFFLPTRKSVGILACLFFIIPLNAQNPNVGKSNKSMQDRTVSGHTIGVNGLGLAYSYEHAFVPRGTIIFSAGASYTYGQLWGLDMKSTNEIYITTKDYHMVTGDIAVEPRFYYNLQKRHRHDKRTYGNSGGYISVNGGYSFPIFLTNGWEGTNVWNITPYWGFRRVWRHFSFDLSGGVGYLASSNGFSSAYISLRIGLGYRF